MTKDSSVATLTTDVLVIGGGPAGTWAAIKAAEAGVGVVLADKGYTGAADSRFRDVEELSASGLLGGYRGELGWGRGRALGARTAVGPTFPG